MAHEFLNLDEVAERLGWSDEQVAAELARRAATAPYEPSQNDMDRLDRVAHLFDGLEPLLRDRRARLAVPRCHCQRPGRDLR